MKKTKGILALIIVLAVLLLAIGYAAIETKILTINEVGVSAEGSENDFVVYFSAGAQDTTNSTKDVVVTGLDTIKYEDTKPTSITFSVAGMKKIEDKAIVKLTVKNESASDITATLSALTDKWGEGKTDAGTYFDVESATWDPVSPTLEKGDTAVVTVAIKCIKTPLSTANETVTLTFNATPSVK